MIDKQELLAKWNEVSKGRTPEEYVKEITGTVLRLWLQHDKTGGNFRYFGGYWEVVYPLMKKYQPELLREYENLVGGFDYFNDEVRKIIDTGEEHLNLLAGMLYMNDRIDSYALSTDSHIITSGDKDIIYVPNQNMEQSNYDD